MTTWTRLWVAALTALWLAGCAAPPPKAPQTVVQTLASNPQLTMWNLLMDTCGLTETLRENGPYTVFAPSNEAFKALPPGTLKAMGDDPEFLKSVMGYHIVRGALKFSTVQSGPVQTLQGTSLSLYKSPMVLLANDVVVISSDGTPTDGVVHIVDRVLLPR
jgi:uncharacterized surface protein with fasciclin (FAS1) repeats